MAVIVNRAVLTIVFLLSLTFVGCEKKGDTSKPQDSPEPSAPVAAGSSARQTAAPNASDDKLALTGLSMMIPKGWVVQPIISTGTMGPKVVLQIPNPNGAPAGVRITHFPGMKGMDDANISRWLGQARRLDGSPATRDDANISVETVGGVRLTKVDTAGSVKPTMRDAPKSNQRMIATIVDHPQGPHFVVITGDKELIDSQMAAIDAFLKSAAVVE